MRVYIGKDELYPYYYISDDNDCYNDEIDLDQSIIKRMKRVDKDLGIINDAINKALKEES